MVAEKMMNEQTQIIKNRFEEAGMPVDDRQADQFFLFYQGLVEKNKVMNLTAITEFQDVLQKHFVDSAMALPLLQKEGQGGKKLSLIDIGTGAGFPGIPLKILMPKLHLILMDALQKRIGFLKEVALELKLEDLTLIHARAEDGVRGGMDQNGDPVPELRETVDVAVSRAVADLSVLSEYCLPYVKTGGCFIAYKSGNIEEELSRAKTALKILGGKIETVSAFTLPGSTDHRSLILIRKIQKTPKGYPRKAGLPAKQPLSESKTR